MRRATVSREAVQWKNLACADVPPDTFFPIDRAGVLAAQAVCARCPLLRQCAAWAKTAGVTDGVVASVLMPTLGADRKTWKAVGEQLDTVAATGVPMESGAERKRPMPWREPEFQHRVAELRDGRRLPWERIVEVVGASRETVRRAYDAYLAAVA
ncbi:WhiB family transcriptional regulator [Nocardia sp. alder85J]|uniref:WhiB family transcriptional regulator n=1 Tax=Nocardia sp. alder85J TaxID=2862949 RepID=UPI001CD7C1AC|nr:WhiB family transcriptional regulator [Nocardia sp. alder85J]MCX4099216.1 WhiB family transcriptional regulator [Nocardia sp. alder85J]